MSWISWIIVVNVIHIGMCSEFSLSVSRNETIVSLINYGMHLKLLSLDSWGYALMLCWFVQDKILSDDIPNTGFIFVSLVVLWAFKHCFWDVTGKFLGIFKMIISISDRIGLSGYLLILFSFYVSSFGMWHVACGNFCRPFWFTAFSCLIYGFIIQLDTAQIVRSQSFLIQQ